MDRKLFRYDKPCAPLGTLPVVKDVALTYPVVLAEVGQVSREADPVRDDYRPDLEWREEVFEFTHRFLWTYRMERAALFPSRMAMPILLGATQSPTL